MSASYPRVPPHSIEAEQSVLGGILLENRAYVKIAGLVSDSDFYRDDHQLIFRALSDMATDNLPIDVVTFSEWMKGRIRKTGYQQQSLLIALMCVMNKILYTAPLILAAVRCI